MEFILLAPEREAMSYCCYVKISPLARTVSEITRPFRTPILYRFQIVRSSIILAVIRPTLPVARCCLLGENTTQKYTFRKTLAERALRRVTP